MTETGSVCLASDDEGEQPEHRRGSFGRPVPGFESGCVELHDPETGSADCDTGELGELWLRGPFLMDGYDGRERHETFDREGWYDTGDLVTVDEDGFVYFTGRSSDMIKTAGANVSPREVEAAVLEVSGLVAHVVGVDDETRGQVVAALVRPRKAARWTAPSTSTACGHSSASACRPTRCRAGSSSWTTADVPVMSSGKLDLRAIKELLGDDLTPRRSPRCSSTAASTRRRGRRS